MSATSLIAGVLLSFLAAAVPTAAWTALVWWCDRYEREPLVLVAASFIWGAFPAVALSLALELFLGAGRFAAESPLRTQVIASSAVAPIVEELAKAAALLLIVLFWRDEIDDVLDGVLYGAMIGFGFAMTENLLYFLQALVEGGWSEWGITIFLRSVLFGLNHAFFTAFTGGALGYARWVRNRRLAWVVPPLGLLAAVGAHAMHNLGASLSSVSPLALLLSLASDAGGVLLVGVIIALALRQERLWLVDGLGSQVGSLLTAEEFELLTSLRGRGQMLAAARRGGWSAVRATRGFQQAATELAFYRYRAQAHGIDSSLAGRLVRLEARLAEARTAMERCRVPSHLPA